VEIRSETRTSYEKTLRQRNEMHGSFAELGKYMLFLEGVALEKNMLEPKPHRPNVGLANLSYLMPKLSRPPAPTATSVMHLILEPLSAEEHKL
jgi:hypothetical protein